MRALIAFFTMFLSLVAYADSDNSDNYVEGVHYELIGDPVLVTSDPGVEVVELFWYGCGHCFNFQPILREWTKEQADDVILIHSPAMWNGSMEVHARAFYTAQSLGVLDRVHQPLFNALNIDRKRLRDAEEVSEIFTKVGVDKDKFMKTFKSFGVTSQIKQADSRARTYKVTGTPEIVVGGKYRVSASTAGSQKNMLKVMDFLIAKVRSEQG